jgi:zinc protease
MEPQQYHRIKNYILNNKLPETFNNRQQNQLKSQSKFFEVKNNQLYKKDRRKKSRNQLLKVVQKHEVEPILYLLHNHPTGAHLGTDKMFEKIRNQLLTAIKQYWDEPRSFVSQLVRDVIYKDHPYNKQPLGTAESIASITRQDLVNFYKQYISPCDACIAVVGDLEKYDIKNVLETALSSWSSCNVHTLEFPLLSPTTQKEVNYPINRDQVVLCFAQLSVARKDVNFDKYLLFDQIFGGGALGSMSSRLFDLREQTGLFYTIRGSLLVGADEQPGMMQVRTIVSLDRLAEAEKVIKETIDTVADTLTEQELAEAKRAVVSSLIDNFSSNSSIASTFLLLKRFGFPVDYFDNRAGEIEKITLDEVKNGVKNILNSSNLITVRAGRV